MTKGLFNLGNTCYFNSALQCLLQVPQLSNLFIFQDWPLLNNNEFAHEYQHLVRDMWVGDKQPDPRRLLMLFRTRYKQFNDSEQQDSQEAFLCLLDMLEESLSPFIKEVFYGKVLQETVCPSETTTKTEDSPVTILYAVSEQSLTDMLKDLQKWNILYEYEDSVGKPHHVATTRTMYFKPPRILTFTIRMYNQKVIVSVPEYFDLLPFIHEKSPHRFEAKYELFAMTTHYGSVQGGHYITYTKHKGHWYFKNDNSCQRVDRYPERGYHYVVLYKLTNSVH